MTYQQFTLEAQKLVAHALDFPISVQLRTTLKNNGKERVGLMISDYHSNLSPTIYLEEHYNQFLAGHSLPSICDNIVALYQELQLEQHWETDAIRNFSQIQSKIVYKLISQSKNKSYLSTVPYIPYQDLAIVFYVLFDINATGTATIPVTHMLQSLWDTSSEELFEIAKSNTPKLLPADFRPMNLVMEELISNSGISCEIEEENPMYVLTNSLRCFGASCILYPNVLQRIGKQLQENYYLLPSSVHEIIILPESVGPSEDTINDMILEINQTEIDREEVLSDHAYYYDCESGVLSIR